MPAHAASGPLDPTIPRVPVTSRQVPLLGYCAPWHGPDRPPDGATVSVWRLTPNIWRLAPDDETSGPVAMLLEPRRVFPQQETILGALYAPPSLTGAPPYRGLRPIESWPAGVYVFGMADGESFERWWAVEVIITPARPPAASPG
jgi:hypothetical protein